MTDVVQIGWNTPSDEYERFLHFVESERGDRDRYAWVLIENAMREFLDEDHAVDLEDMVDKAIQAGGCIFGVPDQEKSFPSR